MVLILLNFLLAIICDAFGEVKGAASESTSVLEEVGPMMVEMWRSVADKKYISDATILRQLKARFAAIPRRARAQLARLNLSGAYFGVSVLADYDFICQNI